LIKPIPRMKYIDNLVKDRGKNMEVNEKITKIYMSAIFLYLIILVTAMTTLWLGTSKILPVVVVLWVILVIPLYYALKTIQATGIYLLINGIISGITVAIFHVHFDIEGMIHPLVAVGFIGLILVNSLSIRHGDTKRKIAAIYIGLGVVGLIIGGYLTFMERAQGSWVLFSAVIVLCINISMYYWLKQGRVQQLERIIRHYNMLIFGGILFVILTSVTEGENLDFFGSYSQDTQKKN